MKKIVFSFLAAFCLAFMLTSCPGFNATRTGSVRFCVDGSKIGKSLKGSGGSREADSPDRFLMISLKGTYSQTQTVPLVDETIVTFDDIPVGSKIRAIGRVYELGSGANVSSEHTLYSGESEEIVVKDGVNELALLLGPPHRVTFTNDDGAEINSQTVEYGRKAVRPDDPTKEGYIFDGWYVDANYTSEFDFSTPITADKILYAKWIEFQTTSYTELPPETDGTAGTSGTYVNFGDWPQTIKADSVTVDETRRAVIGAYTYYKGSDGAWYAKLSSKYYKVEPIKWRVLTDNYNGKKLLLAESILINCAYYDYRNVNRTIGGSTVDPNNYKESRVRAYLNGLSYTKKESDTSEQVTDNAFVGKGFLQTAFTASAQNQIAETTVDNSADSTTDSGNNLPKASSYACENTSDKIFLLSEQEVTTSAYGFAAYNVFKGDSNGTTESSRIRMTTDYAKASGAYQGRWWLRSPSDFYSCVCEMDDIGFADHGSYVNYGNVGVVPALSLQN